jgi:hypothetical protein
MKPRISGRLFWMCSVLIMAALACQNPLSSSLGTAPVPTAVNTAQASTSPTAPKQAGVAPVNLPALETDKGGDADSSGYATKKQAPGGDTFVNGLYERPFNANTMDTYYPYLDIVQTQGFIDSTWGYATISMSGTDANGHLSGKYGVELDLNKDGRGDWLILALSPSSTDWTTEGVQAWKDTDGDVGGTVPLVADKNPSGGDGYETLVFDQGKNANPDGAWVRIDPNDPKTVDLAFKLSMLGDPKSYAMGAWAGSPEMLNPAMFDFNDHMTHAQAGSPYQGDLYYAIKQLAEIDNTCRLAIGFAATNKNPGMCSGVGPRPGGEGGAPPQPPPPPPGVTLK